jgi:tRNA pseudouridine55 synthase
MDGIIVVEKPVDMTSYDVIRRLKKIFDTKKIGHAGTLDPFASGVLIVALNQATKTIRYFAEGDKEYTATLKFGEMTDTYDLTGTVINTDDKKVAEDKLLEVLKTFKGTQLQTPPMFSAKKINGVALYKMARKGLEVERKKATINISRIKLVSFSFPFATIKVRCSKGTYIRSLANDIGIKLGTYAHLTGLKRTKSYPFDLKSACGLDELTLSKEEGRLKDKVIGMNEALSFLPEVVVKDDALKKVSHGIYLQDDDVIVGEGEDVLRAKDESTVLRIVSKEGGLIAVASYLKDEKEYKYSRVFLKNM